jgi:hypothetical protein
MNDEGRVQKLLEDKPGVGRKMLIPKLWWMDDFQTDLRYMGVKPKKKKKKRRFERTELENVMMKGKGQGKRL